MSTFDQDLLRFMEDEFDKGHIEHIVSIDQSTGKVTSLRSQPEEEDEKPTAPLPGMGGWGRFKRWVRKAWKRIRHGI
jgi:hypothetical protein